MAMKAGGALLAALVVGVSLLLTPLAASADPLPSWNKGETKSAIISFVAAVTDPESEAFVPQPERIAVFDNDGNLWAEQPAYFQLFFAIDRAKALVAENPDMAENPAIAAAAAGDMAALTQLGHEGIARLLAETHTGMSVDTFQGHVADWLATARHPVRDVPYVDLVYQPMLELLAYLRAEGFKTYIVSGGGVDFIRVFAEKAYGIPPEQVIGSSSGLEYQEDGDALIKTAEGYFINDNVGKPVGIMKAIGRRPIFASGNSDGDYQMLRWTTAGAGPRLAIILHHDDAEREYAYDRDSSIGRLDRALDEAADRGWVVISMANDWMRIFP